MTTLTAQSLLRHEPTFRIPETYQFAGLFETIYYFSLHLGFDENHEKD
jgi:hypothetical protein